MNTCQLENPSRRIGAPKDWDHLRDGICGTLEVWDIEESGVNYMVSAWMPTPQELARLIEGKPILLWISGQTHPVVSVTVASNDTIVKPTQEVSEDGKKVQD